MLRWSRPLQPPLRLALPPRPGRVVMVLVVSHRGSAQEAAPESQLMVMAVKVALLASAVSAMGAQPALAKGWHMRRHYRSLSDECGAPREVARPATTETTTVVQAQPPQGWEGLQHGVAQAVRDARRALQGDGSYAVSVSTRPDPRAYVGKSSGSQEPVALGWVAFLLALAAGLYLMLGSSIRWPFGGRRRDGEGGRWVYDRSLGGKKIWVPDAPKAKRSLWGDEPMPAATTAAAAAASSFSDTLAALPGTSTTTNSNNGSSGDKAKSVVPEWWVPVRTAVYSTPSRKEELQRQVKGVLRELEDAKLAGMDYPLSALLELRTLCQEGGGLQVRPRTENGRDSMLRTGVRAAMESAMEGGRQLLAGAEPARFVAGLAHDLSVPDTRAVTITHAEVAARCRTLLIDAEAAYRAGDQAQIALCLVKLAQLLEAFPLPLDSAEAELLAGSIQQQTTVEFRKAIFFNFGYMNPGRAPILAEMLGFNPELVMPQLLLQLQAAEQAERLQLQEQDRQYQQEQQRQQGGGEAAAQ